MKIKDKILNLMDEQGYIYETDIHGDAMEQDYCWREIGAAMLELLTEGVIKEVNSYECYAAEFIGVYSVVGFTGVSSRNQKLVDKYEHNDYGESDESYLDDLTTQVNNEKPSGFSPSNREKSQVINKAKFCCGCDMSTVGEYGKCHVCGSKGKHGIKNNHLK